MKQIKCVVVECCEAESGTVARLAIEIDLAKGARRSDVMDEVLAMLMQPGWIQHAAKCAHAQLVLAGAQ